MHTSPLHRPTDRPSPPPPSPLPLPSPSPPPLSLAPTHSDVAHAAPAAPADAPPRVAREGGRPPRSRAPPSRCFQREVTGARRPHHCVGVEAREVLIRPPPLLCDEQLIQPHRVQHARGGGSWRTPSCRWPARGRIKRLGRGGGPDLQLNEQLLDGEVDGQLQPCPPDGRQGRGGVTAGDRRGGRGAETRWI